MQRGISALMAVLIMAVSCPPVPGAEPTPQKQVAIKKKPARKKKLTPQQARTLQKKAEADGKRHQLEMQKRNYQLMLEAQRRGMQQQPQKQQ